ncbi:cytochrome b [Legionella impletisoli]|uniref:Cytochrome b n=1 Tax=Legionella impletisoli TaxID=343510 RepID=A0A917N8P6_9GAMM|nr:cytochrome b [Legionella impletisoli]GGI77019.1 cytochrome b [Legionella impletisoli]
MNSMVQYSSGSKFFHWLIAIMVTFMLCFGFFLDDLPKAIQPFAYMMHKSFGLTVLMLMVLRVIWIVKSGKPSLPNTVPFWEKAFSRIVQYSFYVLLFAMPLSGWIMSAAADKTPVFFGLFKAPLPIAPNQALAKFMNQSHGVIAWVLIGLLVLHVAGAVKHYFWDKDRVLQSMLPN